MSAAPPLLVHAPEHAGAGFAWVAEILLGHWLGLPWRMVEEPAAAFCIAGPAGRLEWPDLFFAAAARGRDARTLPRLPLPHWPVPDAGLAGRIGHARVPLLFAEGELVLGPQTVRLPLDLFGASFFMLSRWEEALPGAPQDRHGRFPAAACIAQQAAVLQRALVDEYVELLWWALSRIAPGLQRAERRARLWVSCDVDAPYSAGVRGPLLALRQAASHVVNDRSAALAARSLGAALAAPFGATRIDPFDTFDYLLEQLERAGQRATFYFIAARRPGGMDGVYRLGEPRIAALLRRLVERGHEIGLHGSYHSADDPALLAEEAAALRAAVQSAGGRPAHWSARQHYLRWAAARTPRHLAEAGFDSDSTLGFAAAPGFRCGTSHAYPMWDLERGRALPIVERPLVAMDASVTSRSYLGLGFGDEARARFDDVAATCRRFGGVFSLLWHNSNLALPGARELFETLIGSRGR